MTLAAGLWLVLLLFATAGWLALTLSALRGRSVLEALPRLPSELIANRPWPKVSVVVPSKDEAAGVEVATRSLLALDYPDLEVVAVDDRSQDGTGAILERLSAGNARLAVVHVRDLPSGWLGKNHANHMGAKAARGEWLLFTDGDVVFAPDALRRAVAYAAAHDLGHLVAIPHFIAPGFLERAFVGAFALFVNLKFKPWELQRPRTSAYIGIGAFNLVRRDAYERAGGHATLAMEVVDDVKLGLILRRSGARQGAVGSGGLVKVRWNAGFRATVRGLVKNSFPGGCEWRWSVALGGALLMSGLSLVPAAGLVFAPGALRLLAAVPVILAAGLHGAASRHLAAGSGAEGLAYVLCDATLVAVTLWSAAAATLAGSIEWRGTRYPIAALRAGCVRERNWPVSAAVGWD